MIAFDKSTYATFVTRWLTGIDNEVFFWSDFFARRGGDWPNAFQRRVEPEPESHLEEHAARCATWPLRALDVGAGPISNVGVRTSRGRIELRACDALAEVYQPILTRAGIVPYVRTEFAFAERLTDVYEENSFDIVTMENALDHSFDPFLGLAEMLRVCRVGGRVLLYHAENEAEHESYNGFHQWNITEVDGRLLVWRAEHRHFADEVFGRFATVRVQRERSGKLWMIRAQLEKTAHPPRARQPLLNVFDQVLLQTSWKLAGDRQARERQAMERQPGGPTPVPLDFTDPHARELDWLRNRVAALEASRSWKLTAPLRWIADWTMRHSTRARS